MIDKTKVYMPDFSSDKGECRNCGGEMSDHDYVSGHFFCLANTKEAMAELLATVAECEKSWQWDLDHGILFEAEIIRARAEFDL